MDIFGADILLTTHKDEKEVYSPPYTLKTSSSLYFGGTKKVELKKAPHL